MTSRAEGEKIIREMVAKDPLIKFSHYTVFHVNYLRDLGGEINLKTDEFSCNIIDAKEFNNCYGKFWLWVLGAYEVIRTLDQNKVCFASSLQTRISEQKFVLAEIRMPFAKLELRGSSSRIVGELSVTSFSDGLGFTIRNRH